MRAHAITTKAPVGGRGRTMRTIVPCGVLALGLAVVLSAATASSTASAEPASAPAALLSTWYCPPPSPPPTTWEQWKDLTTCLGGPRFNFGDRQVGTASPVRQFALGVGCRPGGEYPCPAPFNPTIAVSGDYAQTNNCPATLSAAAPGQVQGCLINVTFTPTGTGPKAGTLSTGAGGPAATLTGNGVTHATPPAFPLEFDVYDGYSPGLPENLTLLKKRLTLYAHTNYDSRVVARGGVKRTVVRVAGSGPPKWKSTRFKAKLKHLRRLKQSPKPKVKIRLTAIDVFGQRATDELKVRLCREARQGTCVR